MVSSALLSEEIKQNIAKVLEPDFVLPILAQRLPEFYPDFQEIKDITLRAHKKHFGKVGAVLVMEYQIKYQASDGQLKSLGIFSSAHSDGTRLAAYKNNVFLYQNGFAQGSLRVTRPLFYLPEQFAYFYQASPGHRLVSFFKKNPSADLRPVFSLVAAWIKKLHSLSLATGAMNWSVFSVENMKPRPQNFLADFFEEDQALGEMARSIYEEIKALEKYYGAKINKSLIYGDNHPENVIVQSLETKHLEMIDFADVAIGDPMIDLGAFLQQFDFMAHNYISREQMNKYKIYLIEDYFQLPFAHIPIENIMRINIYQSWTALRSSTFLFYMNDVEKSVVNLLADCQHYLDLAKNKQREINLF